jgi:pimeloyl-ACP methyl ester carboxylesterase
LIESAVNNSALPFAGELIPAPTQKFRETVVFVHHFGGTKKLLKRHVQFVNALGFDAVTFELSPNEIRLRTLAPINSELKLGARHVWAGQIETVLNNVKGQKIIYSFSMPSAAALEAITNRSAKDISCWVCDGGPFANVFRCTVNALALQKKFKPSVLRAGVSAAATMFFGPNIERDFAHWWSNLPKGFPVLSIRGEKDPLVPLSAIDEAFSESLQIGLEVLSLKDGAHLDGLKNFPELYKPVVEGFLKRSARGELQL